MGPRAREGQKKGGGGMNQLSQSIAGPGNTSTTSHRNGEIIQNTGASCLGKPALRLLAARNTRASPPCRDGMRRRRRPPG